MAASGGAGDLRFSNLWRGRFRLESLLRGWLRFVGPGKFVNPRGIGDQQDAIRFDQYSQRLQRGALRSCHAVVILQISVAVETQQHVADRGPYLLARAIHAQRVNHRLHGYVPLALGELHHPGEAVQTLLPETVAVAFAVFAVPGAGVFHSASTRWSAGKMGAGKTSCGSSGTALRAYCSRCTRWWAAWAIGAHVMFKTSAESAAESGEGSGEGSGAKNSGRAEPSARSPHAEQCVEVRRVVVSVIGRDFAAVA